MSNNPSEQDEKMKEFWKRLILIEDFIKNNEGLVQDSGNQNDPTSPLDSKIK